MKNYSDPELVEMTAVQIADSIRKRTVSPVALVDACLRQIQRLESSTKAWATVAADSAIETAHQLEAEAANGRYRGHLHGVPIGIKDTVFTSGIRTMAGSPLLKDFVPTYDATVVKRLKAAGAIILGKTVTTEFGCGDPPPTINAWNPAHTPGGSSSGSAVAVAARMCPLAIGTQTGGSTLRPASYNGVIGFKPTYGRISRFGVVPVSWSLDTIGMLARTVADAGLIFSAITGVDDRDPTTVALAAEDYSADLLSVAPRIGVVETFFRARSEPETWRHTLDTVGALALAGAEIKSILLPEESSLATSLQLIIDHVESAAFHERTFRKHAARYGQMIANQILTGLLIPGAQYVQALRFRRRLRSQITVAAEGCDALLTPATPGPAPATTDNTGDPVFQSLWSLCGLPAINLPTGLTQTGLPLGIQLIGMPFREKELLSIASWCEARVGRKLAPPALGFIDDSRRPLS